jgi:hypothetical protein
MAPAQQKAPASLEEAGAQLDDKAASCHDVILGLDPLLSGLNFVDMAHGVDSTRIRAFGDDLGHERGTTPCGTRLAFFMIF